MISRSCCFWPSRLFWWSFPRQRSEGRAGGSGAVRGSPLPSLLARGSPRQELGAPAPPRPASAPPWDRFTPRGDRAVTAERPDGDHQFSSHRPWLLALQEHCFDTGRKKLGHCLCSHEISCPLFMRCTTAQSAFLLPQRRISTPTAWAGVLGWNFFKGWFGPFAHTK